MVSQMPPELILLLHILLSQGQDELDPGGRRGRESVTEGTKNPETQTRPRCGDRKDPEVECLPSGVLKDRSH